MSADESNPKQVREESTMIKQHAIGCLENGPASRCNYCKGSRKPLSPKQAAYLFFLRNAGYSYDPKIQTKQQGRSAAARQLAKAERDARALGYRFEWTDDWDIGNHRDYYGADSAYADQEPNTCESCLMRDAQGKVVQSLGCIDDATSEYRRVVEAELALEQLG